jgi:hypothetical protein
MVPYTRALRSNGSIDPTGPEGALLLRELCAFFDDWDSSEQVEIDGRPSWADLERSAREAGLVEVAPMIPAIRLAMGDRDGNTAARVDIVRWVRAHLAVAEGRAKGRAEGPVEHLSHKLSLLGAMHVDAVLAEQEAAFLASLEADRDP